jgi:hypothetical protein
MVEQLSNKSNPALFGLLGQIQSLARSLPSRQLDLSPVGTSMTCSFAARNYAVGLNAINSPFWGVVNCDDATVWFSGISSRFRVT